MPTLEENRMRMANSGVAPSSQRRNGSFRIGSIMLLLFVLAFVWPRYFFLSVIGFGVSGYMIATLGLILFSIYILFSDNAIRRTVSTGYRATIIPVLLIFLFFLWKLMSDLAGETPAISVEETVQDFVYQVGWILIGAVAFTIRAFRRKFPFMVVCFGLIAMVFGVIEAVAQRPLLDALGLAQIATGDRKQLIAIAAASSGESGLRVKSIFTHPIIFGQTMALVTPFALHLLSKGRRFERLAAFVVLPCIPLSIILCQSRSPVIVLALVVAVYVLLLNMDVRRKSRLQFLFLIYIVGMVAMPVAIQQVTQITVGETRTERHSSEIRLIQFRKAMRVIEQEPVSGYGTGRALFYAGVQGRNNVRTLDSHYLTVLVSNGYIGLALQLLVFIMVGLSFAGATIRSREDWDRGVRASFAAIVVGIAGGLSILSITDALTFFYLAVGYLIASTGIDLNERKRIKRAAIQAASAHPSR